MNTIGAVLPRITRRLPLLGILAVAVVAGQVLTFAPSAAFGAVLALVLLVAVVLHPPVAAYTLLAATPLLAGMERGGVVPLLRPHEALVALVVAAVLVRRLMVGATEKPASPDPVDRSILLLVAAGSVLPLLWMVLRGREITQLDLLYALVLAKYGAIYLVVRVSIRTETQVKVCFWLSLGAGAIVAVVGILQALDLLGMRGVLAARYLTRESSSTASDWGTATVGDAHALADLMVFNLMLCVALLLRGERRGALLFLATLLTLGSFASGEFSGPLAALVGIGALGYVTGCFRKLILRLIPIAVLAMFIMQPVVNHRLSQFDSGGGVPQTWQGRVENLDRYVLPQLTADFNYVLGVRPVARAYMAPAPNADYVFIESGYLWCLWTGGVPLLLAFAVFLRRNLRATAAVARARDDMVGAGAAASFAVLTIVAVFSAIDPHLTFRASADLSFALLAVAHMALRGQEPDQSQTASPDASASLRGLVPHLTSPDKANPKSSGVVPVEWR